MFAANSTWSRISRANSNWRSALSRAANNLLPVPSLERSEPVPKNFAVPKFFGKGSERSSPFTGSERPPTVQTRRGGPTAGVLKAEEVQEVVFFCEEMNPPDPLVLIFRPNAIVLARLGETS